MADFIGDDLKDSRFERVNLAGARLSRVDFTGAGIYGEIGRLSINGVEVRDLVEAELDRRHPDRVKMRPTDAAGFREAWDPLDLPWDEMRDIPGVPRDREARPSLEVCLLVVLNEEWEHRLYAERDLGALIGHGS